MKLGLLGYPVNHSLSPSIYKRLLGEKLTSYELFSFDHVNKVPPLEYFKMLDGLNITSPYKKVFINQIKVTSKLVHDLGIVNTLAFKDNEVHATNTDLLAVVEILKNYKKNFSDLRIKLLGSGSMAKVTKLVAADLDIPLEQFSRSTNGPLEHLDLRHSEKSGIQTLIINSCSRDFVFQGQITGNEIFWDYNYSFAPHENTLPGIFNSYVDGREMLELQAKEAVKFWYEVNPKLK